MNKFYSYIAFVISLLVISDGYSQTYGNEWIQYNQEYYSFKIYPNIVVPFTFGDESGIETGIYKIDYNTLISSGIDPTSFSSENIQIFGREKEIPLYIVDGGDSSIDPSDYILFYTERNDGWLDSTIYKDPEGIGNPYYSIYSDTIEYFFTWNNSTNNLRYTEESTTNYASFTPSNYIFYDKWGSYHYQYQEGERISKGSSSFYTFGEGWANYSIDGVSGSQSGIFNLGTVQVKYPYQGAGAPNVLFEAMQVGESNAVYSALGNHHVLWSIGASNYSISDSIWIGYRGIKISKQFPTSILPASGGSNLGCRIINDQGAVTDYQSISFFKLKYPRIPSFDGENQIEFNVENNPSEANIRLDLSNLSFNNPIGFVLGDVPKKINFALNGAVYTTLISNSTNGAEQHVVYQDSASVKTVTSLSPVNGNSATPAYFTDFGSIVNKERALLMITHSKLQNASNNYIAYRNSMAGGNYNTISADIDELYQQFGAGIPQHINSVRRFSHFMYNQATEKPVGLYLMGKAIKQATVGALTGTRNNPIYTQESLIPSFGEPGSDICITAGLEGAYRWSPLISTGRLSARTDIELQGYLDKVIKHELEQDSNSVYDTPAKDWQKQVLHFVGGSTGPQQTQFKFYMDNMRDILEDSLFAGNVNSIYKTNSNPLSPSTITSITDRIANGVSLMTYFGHATASTSGFEINLDEPSNWNNSSKFPIMLVNACYNGNIYQYTNSYSEDFVQVPNYGAIAYLASVNVGYDVYLNYYSNNLYNQFSRYAYGATISQQMKNNIETIEPQPPTDNLYLETTCTQMVLNGDPMVRLNYHVKPEIELLAENVWFTPENPDLTVDSIEMHILLKNLGRSIVDSFLIEVRRNFPSTSTDSVYVFKLGNLHYTKEFTFKFPLQPNISLGLNSFDISVDLPTVIEEVYDEVNNNRITTTLFLDIDGIIPVSPYKFAVVPIDSVTVHASTNNPIADYNAYRFEMDTIDFVGAPSPAHRFAIISGFGGVKSVNPSEWTLTSSGVSNTLVCEDSVVYFWRVSIVGDTTWKESSFQYIPNKQGWGQDHFFQFKDNGFNGLTYNRSARTKEFTPKVDELNCYVVNSLANISSSLYEINATQQEYGACTVAPTLHVAIIDPITHEPWGTRYGTENPTHNFGNANDNGVCRPRVEKFFLFRENDPAQIASFQNLVNSIVPDGHYILIYSPLYTRYDLWNSIDSIGMYSTFFNLGSDSIFPGRPNLPFAFFVRKGDTTTVVEYVSQNSSDDFKITASLVGPIDRGSETSPVIGPTTNWGSLHWKQDPLEVSSSDSTQLIIKTYDLAGNFQTQIDTSFTLDDSVINLGSLIDANQYPFISLEAYYKDTLALTPAQIDRWHVLYSPVPEAAIDGTSQYFWSAIGDTVTEGEMMSFAVDVKNIYSVDMDSLLINYWIEDVNNVKQYISYSRQDSLRVGATLRDTITFSTVGLGGTNILWMEVNPYVNGSVFITDQPEQEHFNNLLQLPFSVRPDDENPLLDVTFNGNHILNGDIVDPNSEIYITLKDDNEFLIMDDVSDTTRFGIYLTDPNGLQKRIPFEDGTGNTVMQWIPANSSNKRFKIIWPAGFDKDGTYSLLVQGSDKSDNLSGDIDYRVSFEVIHESTITQMMNYPNPFSTSTRFVFTLTGSEVPDDIIIQIMTVTGRVVREITEDQLGPIQIGRNITEYAWNGTDEFGDPLANGVYLYYVRAKINGEDIKQRESGADQYFKKSFGKMYLLR